MVHFVHFDSDGMLLVCILTHFLYTAIFGIYTVIADAALILTLIGVLVLFYVIDKLPHNNSRFSTQIVKIIK